MLKWYYLFALNLITIFSMGQITAKDFFSLWNGFIQEKITNNSDWKTSYDDNKTWTEKTIGSKSSESCNSPFGNYVKDKVQLRYRKEDGLTDLSFSQKIHFEGIYSLHEKKEERKPVIEDSTYYPQCFEILVEHENDIYYCYEEMVKLTYDRARLKVLITYNEDIHDTKDYKFVEKILVENFKKIISQANLKYPENSETEYLLIIGQRNENNLNWSNYIFNSNGL